MPTTSLQLANIQPPHPSPWPSLETQNSVKAHLLDKNAGEHLEEMLKRPTPFSADNKPPRGLKTISHLPVRFCRDAISTALFGSFVKVIYKSLHNCSLQSRLQGPACPFQTADHARCLIRMLQIVFFALCFSDYDPRCSIMEPDSTNSRKLLNVWYVKCRGSHSQFENLHSFSHRAFLQVAADAGWTWEAGWSHTETAAWTPHIRNTLKHTGISGPVPSFLDAAVLLGWPLASHLLV